MPGIFSGVTLDASNFVESVTSVLERSVRSSNLFERSG